MIYRERERERSRGQQCHGIDYESTAEVLLSIKLPRLRLGLKDCDKSEICTGGSTIISITAKEDKQSK